MLLASEKRGDTALTCSVLSGKDEALDAILRAMEEFLGDEQVERAARGTCELVKITVIDACVLSPQTTRIFMPISLGIPRGG